MKRIVELRHVGPRQHVQSLLDALSKRLEEKLSNFQPDAVTLHVLFQESGNRKLYRVAVTCHVPGHTVAAHEEQRVPGLAIRKAFAELTRQLEKQKAFLRHDEVRTRPARRRQAKERLVRELAAELSTDQQAG